MKKNIQPLFKNKKIKKKIIFQQDNVSVHVSKETKIFFEKKIRLLDWPDNSPDLNPIENIWGIMSKRIYSSGSFSDLFSLKKKIKEVWNSLDQEIIQNVILSMPDQ